jgi:putative ABC transport system permease protein
MDLLYAVRSLRKNPGYTILAMLVLALGIGANTAIFSAVNAVLLRPLAYREPDRARFSRLARSEQRLRSVAYYADDRIPVTAGTEPERAVASVVTPEFFQVMGVQPVAGRLFLPEEEQKGGCPATVISYSFWQQHLGGAASALNAHVATEFILIRW